MATSVWSPAGRRLGGQCVCARAARAIIDYSRSSQKRERSAPESACTESAYAESARTQHVEGLELHGAVLRGQRPVERRVLHGQAGVEGAEVGVELRAQVDEHALALAYHALGGAHEVERETAGRAVPREKLGVVLEIGRASCRERV